MTIKWNEGLITSHENAETPEDEDKAQADTIFDIMLDMQESTRGQLTIKNVAEYIFDRYEMDSLDYTISLLKARASYLVELMDDSKVNWARKPIYKHLKTAAQSPNTHDLNTPVQPKPSEVVEISSSSDEESCQEGPPRGNRRRARMSILRPKLSSVSAKRAGKYSKRFSAAASDLEDDLDDTELADETPSKPGGHRLIRNGLPTRENGTKPSFFRSESNNSRQKRNQSQQIPEQTENADLSSDESSIITSESESELPPDTWVCSVPGCSKTVYKTSSRRSKDVINDHSLVHAEDTETKMNLVFAEQRLNVNASVDYLLNKIRDYGAFQEGSASGEAVDSELKRIKLEESTRNVYD